jgi:hypothetical protein
MENFINWLKKEKEVSTEEINNSLSVDDIINNVKAVYADKLSIQTEEQVPAAKIPAPQTKPMSSPTVGGGKGQVAGPQKVVPQKKGQVPVLQQKGQAPAPQQPPGQQQAKPLVGDGATAPAQIQGQKVNLPTDPTARAKMLQAMLQRGQGQVKK